MASGSVRHNSAGHVSNSSLGHHGSSSASIHHSNLPTIHQDQIESSVQKLKMHKVNSEKRRLSSASTNSILHHTSSPSPLTTKGSIKSSNTNLTLLPGSLSARTSLSNGSSSVGVSGASSGGSSPTTTNALSSFNQTTTTTTTTSSTATTASSSSCGVSPIKMSPSSISSNSSNSGSTSKYQLNLYANSSPPSSQPTTPTTPPTISLSEAAPAVVNNSTSTSTNMPPAILDNLKHLDFDSVDDLLETNV